MGADQLPPSRVWSKALHINSYNMSWFRADLIHILQDDFIGIGVYDSHGVRTSAVTLKFMGKCITQLPLKTEETVKHRKHCNKAKQNKIKHKQIINIIMSIFYERLYS